MIRDLGNYIATGGACDIYEYGENKVVKLYFEGYGMDHAKREFDKTLKIWEQGLPVPRPYEVIEIDERFGVVIDHIHGKTFSDMLFKNMIDLGTNNKLTSECLAFPEINWHLRKTAEILHMMHSKTVTGLINFSDSLKWDATHTQFLTEDEGVIISDYIDTLPKGDRLCHGDPNPGNYIDNDGKITIIDLVSAGIGNPMIDLAEYAVMIKFIELPGQTPQMIKDFICDNGERIISMFFDAYRELSFFETKQVDDWLLPMAVSKLRASAISDGQKQKLLAFIRERIRN